MEYKTVIALKICEELAMSYVHMAFKPLGNLPGKLIFAGQLSFLRETNVFIELNPLVIQIIRPAYFINRLGGTSHGSQVVNQSIVTKDFEKLRFGKKMSPKFLVFSN